MHLNKDYFKPILSLFLILFVSCNSGNKRSEIDTILSDYRSKEYLFDLSKLENNYTDSIIGYWLIKENQDTVVFSQIQELHIKTENGFNYLYRIGQIMEDKSVVMQIMKSKCDTFYNALNKIDSISCSQIELINYSVSNYSNDSIVLDSFINETGKITLERL